MKKQAKLDFKWMQYPREIVMTCVSWYLRYPLSLRDLEEMMELRGLKPDHSTVWHWVDKYSVTLSAILRKKAKRPQGSWRVDETYIKVKGKWVYLYRAVDKNGLLIDFMLSAKRDIASAIRFFEKAIKGNTENPPYAITTDKNASYPPAINQLKEKGAIPITVEHRTNKYLNNIVEQDHRRIKRPLRGKGPFKTFQSTKNTLTGIESHSLFRKKQVDKSVFFEIV
ncbi:MAG: hypothetical protein A2007_06035 [Verrucomicrobia bacterium GWC2_42_7]|nr:MAG: hypothetical protein A2007_06035 [Verrucomicrobia bacterium GWC2_42_7]